MYNTPYNPRVAYVIPVGVPPHIAQKMMEASRAFRMFDVDHSGTISQKGKYQ